MRSKTFLFSFLFLFLLSGCVSPPKPANQVSTSQDAVAKAEAKVDATLTKIEKNEKGKKIQTSVLATGIQHSLSQITNPPVQVDTAKNLNERVISIVGSPHIDEIKRIKATVDLLNSALEEERKKGQELISQRDQIINKLQKEKSELNEKYDDELWAINDKAKEVAKQADNSKATLDAMGGMFGLNAVIWGLKKFFVSALTTIIIFVVVFVILRLLATVHPAAAGVFSIFNMIGSALLSIVKILTPNAFSMAKFVPSADNEHVKGTLTKIVDVIQELKEKQKESSDRVYPLSEILKRFDKEMDSDEKELIDELLKELKWVK